MIRVEPLQENQEAAYDKLAASWPESLIYGTLAYRSFLRRMTGADDRYLVALRGRDIVGGLPVFALTDPQLGTVLNSLPFYGSHGGCLVHPEETDRLTVKRAILEAFRDMAQANGILAACLIEPLREPDTNLYREILPARLYDERIGQLSRLPNAADAEISEGLMTSLDKKTRNMVRKALKSGVRVRTGNSNEDWHFLWQTHRVNIEALRGLAKPWKFFETIQETIPAEQRSLWIAEHEGRRVAGLLLFYHQRIVEYITPVVVEEARSIQPTSALIFEAMVDAIQRGCMSWNWGGTWLSQHGVSRFKKSWGAVDHPYTYHILTQNEDLLAGRVPKEQLLSSFPYFYTVPFDKVYAQGTND